MYKIPLFIGNLPTYISVPGTLIGRREYLIWENDLSLYDPKINPKLENRKNFANFVNPFFDLFPIRRHSRHIGQGKHRRREKGEKEKRKFYDYMLYYQVLYIV